MKMELYHFTARHLFEQIKTEGITKGMAPICKYPEIRWSKKYRWLTHNPSFSQAWDKGLTIPYSRTDIRIKINIPEEKNIIWWLNYCESKKNHPFIRDLNNQNFTNPNEWYLYQGNIPVNWFIEAIDRNEVNVLE